MNTPKAFTLIELLVVIAIIALLMGILLPTLGGARRAAQATAAVAACRTLGQAYVLYSNDHRGCVIPAHLDATQPRDVTDEFGNTLSAPVSQRWVYRLGPYFDYAWAGATHVGSRKELLSQFTDITKEDGMFIWSYHVSVFPSFGINRRFVGGDHRRPDWLAQNHHVTRIDQALQPTRLIVFGSARFKVTPTFYEGNADIEAPPLGSAFDEHEQTASPAKAYGNNHPRYEGNSAIVFMDAHAGLVKAADLLDRTRWSDRAARAGNPGWEP